MVINVFYVGRKYRTNATGEYNTDTGEVTVFKGSIVSETIRHFRRTEEIKVLRDKYTDANGTLMQDITFNSPSASATFVSGYSVSGLHAWHVEKHKTLKTYLQEQEK